MTQRSRNLRRAVVAALLLVAAGSAGLYFAVLPGHGVPGLPKDARDALLAQSGLAGQPGALRVREVEQIGPYLAVIYTAAGNIGAGLLSREGAGWNMAGVLDPGPLRQAAQGGVGAASLRAGGIEVVFVAAPGREVDRVVVTYPIDGTVLDRRVAGQYAVLWRPAPTGDGGYSVESYDRSGRRLAP